MSSPISKNKVNVVIDEDLLEKFRREHSLEPANDLVTDQAEKIFKPEVNHRPNPYVYSFRATVPAHSENKNVQKSTVIPACTHGKRVLNDKISLPRSSLVAHFGDSDKNHQKSNQKSTKRSYITDSQLEAYRSAGIAERVLTNP